ncbi:DNA polymerase III subunit alpha [Desulfococcus sp.]|uniref:DNA polymerase III subunit alpha n=1 Tax=Desulfococcus sp. TaxID=2025834 RepID=UPI0035936589
MESREFVHLHLHSEYSLLDGAIRITPLFKHIKAVGMDAVAITDHGTMSGVVEFYKKALAAGVKPLIGCEFYVAPRKLTDKTSFDRQGVTHLVLIAETMEGYFNLCRLASISQLKGFYYKPRIDRDALAANSKGLIATSACLQGQIPRLLLKNRIAEADDAARFFQGVFGEKGFFLEVQDNGLPEQSRVNQQILEMSARLSMPIVATNDCHYLYEADALLHDVPLCIQQKKTLQDPNRFRFSTGQLYLKSPREMKAAFGDYRGAIENTRWIADRCHVELGARSFHLPHFTSEEERSSVENFETLVHAGLKRRLDCLKASRKNPIDEEAYRQRLVYELGVIERMNYAGYFLIVADFIEYARRNGIPVGPGRGSAAGSLVAYALGITQIDPLEHGLIFERFLNPSRVSMPDIDVDFCINGRARVIDYVVERYGRDHVAQIITFGRLGARGVLRDVGRVLGIPAADLDRLAKMVPERPGITLETALSENSQLRQWIQARPDLKRLMGISQGLEGSARHASTHAAGVVIADRPLVDLLPLCSGKNNEMLSQYEMGPMEAVGLVKFDFLGLRNLTVIDNTLKLIAKTTEPLDLSDLDLDDASTYSLLSAGDTHGVFQLESPGMRGLITRLQPSCFSDLVALLALYRPGPLESGMVNDFVERKHERQEIKYLFASLRPILEETYGVVLYQEQVMRISAEVAGYSMADADELRKAMGKKISSLMTEHRTRFIEGAVKRGYPEDNVSHLFDILEKFGGYGFNKSHSTAYALISYQTAYLKAHYPVAFMTALLNSEIDSADGVAKLSDECRRSGITLLPPDINYSDAFFKMEDGRIRFGMGAVKMVGTGTAESIVDARRAGSLFTSLWEVKTRVGRSKSNKGVIEALIKAGAFDSTGYTRASMLAELTASASGKAGKKMKVPIGRLAESLPELGTEELLMYEKEYLGAYLSSTPLELHQDAISCRLTTDISGVKKIMEPRKVVTFVGMISQLREITDKKHRKMAFLSVADAADNIDVVVFASKYQRFREWHDRSGELGIFTGTVDISDRGHNVILLRVSDVCTPKLPGIKGIHVKVDKESFDEERQRRFKRALLGNPGEVPFFVHLRCGNTVREIYRMDCTCTPSHGLRDDLHSILGADAVGISS